MQDGIRDFEARTAKRVQLNVITDKYMDVMRSRFAARKTPDVFYLDAHEAPFLVQSGVLLPFDATLDRLADVYPQYLDAFRGADGRVYGVPKDASTLALYVNTTLLKSLGLKLADLPRDHEELLTFVVRLQPKLPAGHAAMIYERDLARHCQPSRPMASRSSPLTAAPCSPAIAAPCAIWKASSPRGRPAPSSAPRTISATTARAQPSARPCAADDGRQLGAGLHEPGPPRGALRDAGDAHHRGPPPHDGLHDGVCRVAPCGHPEAGYAFARLMTGERMEAWTRKVGFLPTRPSVAQRLLTGDIDASARAHATGLAYATVWSRGTSLPVINNNFGNEFQAVLNGSKNVRAALAAAETASNREIERQR